LSQLSSRRTVPAPDIDYFTARFDLCFLSHDIHQMSRGGIWAFPTAYPKPVMHVFAPQFSIEHV
jgi:hypothetical protein